MDNFGGILFCYLFCELSVCLQFVLSVLKVAIVGGNQSCAVMS